MEGGTKDLWFLLLWPFPSLPFPSPASPPIPFIPLPFLSLLPSLPSLPHPHIPSPPIPSCLPSPFLPFFSLFLSSPFLPSFPSLPLPHPHIPSPPLPFPPLPSSACLTFSACLTLASPAGMSYKITSFRNSFLWTLWFVFLCPITPWVSCWFRRTHTLSSPSTLLPKRLDNCISVLCWFSWMKFPCKK